MATDGGYAIEFTPAAARSLRALPGPVLGRVTAAIDDLAGDPRPRGCKQMAGRPPRWRIRVGDHRVIYRIDDRVRIVGIMSVGRRDDIYRKDDRR